MKPKRGTTAMLVISGATLSADGKRVVGVLDKHLARAIELGRNDVAIAIVGQLGDALGVKNTVISNNVFNGGSK